MPDRIEHLQVPFGLDTAGRAQTVDQDSLDEITQAVRVLIGTQPGDRPAVPTYGTDDLTFQALRDIADDAWLVEAVEQWEPRATTQIVRAAITESGRADVTVEVSS